jgi:hypothetical protein
MLSTASRPIGGKDNLPKRHTAWPNLQPQNIEAARGSNPHQKHQAAGLGTTAGGYNSVTRHLLLEEYGDTSPLISRVYYLHLTVFLDKFFFFSKNKNPMGITFSCDLLNRIPSDALCKE